MADYAKGDVLLQLRKKTGLSREKAAAEIGVTTKTLFTWEMENGGIRLQNAQRLAEFYGVGDPSTLLTSSEAGGDQLDRIEAMLTAVVAHLGIEVPTPGEVADVFEEEDPQPGGSRPQSAPKNRKPRRSAEG